MNTVFDVIVCGGGHAGCEAAAAAARMGAKTLLVTQSVERIAAMSCNPAIGGTAKGHLVKEIDALGGLMGKAIDKTGIQFRVLNRKKGPAVWSSRAQADMDLYRRYMKHTLENIPGLTIRQDTVDGLIHESDLGARERVCGIQGQLYGSVRGKTVIITSGTFLNGLIHVGQQKIRAGRAGESASLGLAEFIRKAGFRVGRLKTGTTPRLDGKTIAWEQLAAQDSDADIIPFSFSTEEITQKLIPCHITHTNAATHAAIAAHRSESPLYSGEIVGIGPRYCPSIEDKVFRFPDRTSHQIFLEPQGYDTCEVYPNGISTSLPLKAQYEFVRTIKGLEKAEIIRPGYAIEYDFVEPTELCASLETKRVKALFLAGQVNGTTGYEEAAAQGLMAGINAALLALDRGENFILHRSEAYIGVLIDDLITKGTREPYRMFTSRAEHRLYLREDNADTRLTDKGRGLGLVGDADYQKFVHRQQQLRQARDKVTASNFGQAGVPDHLFSAKDNPGTGLVSLFKRPELTADQLADLVPLLGSFETKTLRRLAIELKYEGYIAREREMAVNLTYLDKVKIPSAFKYDQLDGLRAEIVEKLTEHRPENLGQASRISGVTPAAIHLLQVYLRQHETGVQGI